MEVERSPDRIAVFLDVENLAIHAQQQGLQFEVCRILERVRSEGRVTFSRAYGDWSKPYMRGIHEDLKRSVLELAQLPTDTKGKNTADMQLSLDALEMCLQPSPPTSVVIGAGDRDYVPLVQKLRRYGIHTIGIGLKGSISASLERICDDYWYYDDLPSVGAVLPVVAEEAESDPMQAAVADLLRALDQVAARDLPCTGGNTVTCLRDISPGFDVKALGFASFKQFAEAAEESGHIRIGKKAGMDFTMAPVSSVQGSRPTQEPDGEQLRSDHIADLCRRYRDVLAAKKVPLLSWRDRERLVRKLWDRLTAAGDGMAIKEMSDALADDAALLGIYVPPQALYKITYTLNLGRCFKLDGVMTFVEDIFDTKVEPACDVDEALDRMHVTYLRGIRLDAPHLPLDQDAVARLLYENPTDTQMNQAVGYINTAIQWRD